MDGRLLPFFPPHGALIAALYAQAGLGAVALFVGPALWDPGKGNVRRADATTAARVCAGGRTGGLMLMLDAAAAAAVVACLRAILPRLAFWVSALFCVLYVFLRRHPKVSWMIGILVCPGGVTPRGSCVWSWEADGLGRWGGG